mgnify:FL=1|tara:strand:- start:41 stop:1003 length:963 start_codon:yes stop_codon:yes gene_type:complete
MTNETKFFDKELKHYQAKTEWKEAHSIIDNYIDTASTFETSREQTIRDLGIKLHKLFSEELSNQLIMVNAQSTLSTLYDELADQTKEVMQQDFYKNLKKRVCRNLIVDTFNSNVSMALENGSASYKSGKKTIKNEWLAGDMIANQNELAPMSTDENGVTIPNKVTAKQSVPTRAIDNFFSIIIGGNTKNKPDGIIGKFKQVNELLISEVLALRTNPELLVLVNQTSDIIDNYIVYSESFDASGNESQQTLEIGKNLVRDFNSEKILLNKVKLPKKFKSKKVIGNVKAEAIENFKDQEAKLVVKDKTNISLDTEKPKKKAS